MTYKYQHLMALTPNALHNTLMKRNLPTAVREEMKSTITAQKSAQKSMRAKAIKVHAEWRPLLEGLRMERESLRSMRNYRSTSGSRGQLVPNQQEITALDGYAMVLDKLHSEFELHKRNLVTPAVLARERGLPNGGIHWTDWIKDKFKERVRLLFDAIPHRQGAKVKQPFVRKTDPKSNARLTTRLRIRTLKEHGIAEQDYQLNPTERSKAKLDKLIEAIKRIDRLSPTDPVPRTWSGLFTHEGETI